VNRDVHAIAGRLSLRPPQRESLEILAKLCEQLPLQKGSNVADALKIVREAFPNVTDFERDFPSLCFALATGVGKTRLMGAFIAYLARAESIRHFFVLAPNLTIYEKLIRDFTPNTPKYVFAGISEFAVNPPVIITGDNYESGLGVRRGRGALQFPGMDLDVHVNIFNVSKITSSESGARRFRTLHEVLGESYFDYLSKLDDLVMLMDESHRYRASAGMRAISELNPILGLELTATPQIERGGDSVPFKNVAYAYPLSQAMTDGFVKEPAVGTRRNFDARNYEEKALEKLKLEDGIRVHEITKVELQTYAQNNGLPVVKPFVLVIARDTAHAEDVKQRIESNAFFEGRYAGKVITVHSKLKGEEGDETVQQLIDVEKADNPTEIVVHVNMLKEGWDVTNLYTIVPLRAANSKTLVEQSIGRGLRLPYGARTGVPAVDCLTIVAHDKFQEIVDYANSSDSIVRGGMRVVYIGDERTRAVAVEPAFASRIAGVGEEPRKQPSLFATPREQETARLTMQVLQEFERLPRSADLMKPEMQKKVVERVQALLGPSQGVFPGTPMAVDVPSVVKKAIALHNELTIDIPRITFQPVGEVTRRYLPFKVALTAKLQPPDDEILIHELREQKQRTVVGGSGVVAEARPEAYVVRALVAFDDVDYESHSHLLYELAEQVTAYLRSYLTDEDQVLKVLQYHHPLLASQVHAQMQQHYEEKVVRYEAHVSKGFTTLRPNHYTTPSHESVRDYRQTVLNKEDIPKLLFGGFTKCLYDTVKFGSDPERRFAVIIERDALKWFRPSKHDLRMHYDNDNGYQPDFVVETKDRMFIVEVKDATEMSNPVVVKKKNVAVQWCAAATQHARDHGGKPWTYVLVPDSAISDNKTLDALVATHRHAEAADSPAQTKAPAVPFQRVEPREAEKYRSCVPLFSLKAAAGGFSDLQATEPEAWVTPATRHKLSAGMFVAQVKGKSMEPTIPDGAYCLFSSPVAGARAGRTVLVGLTDAIDPESSERFTVKRYASKKDSAGRNVKVTLQPVNPAFGPIEFEVRDEGDVRVVAELVEVLPAQLGPS
jgi:type III restriction enzyme